MVVQKVQGAGEGHPSILSYREMDNQGHHGWVRMEESCPVENSVGTLVWVRRRNGHWWPGRVLAAHEVPRLHLLGPKSGSPVQLLGKDDASVDWYNIGKSRRIKAFRCGEFDDCIERARSFGSLRSKNREKYARRDDAILHALELEKRQAEGRQRLDRPYTVGAVMGLTDLPKHGAVTDDIRGSNHVDAMPSSEATKRAVLIPQATRVFNSIDLPSRRKSPMTSEWENGITEAIPRMRDLQDIGLQIANSKGSKTKCRSILEAPSIEDGISSLKHRKTVYKNTPEVLFAEDGTNKIESCITRITTGVSSAPSVTKASSFTFQKRKKHPAGSSADESSYKKRDRRRPLTQVLKESSNKVAVSGRESSALPLSTANCQTRMYWSDGTEATSSQEPFQQAANEFRPCSEHRDFDLLQGVHRSSYGFKQEQYRPLVDSDKPFTSFWPNYWDASRWPSLVSAQMDFGLLLGSAYMDSLYEGTKSASRFSGMAYTGSATSVNTTNFDKPDSFKYLHQGGGPNSISCVGHNACKNKNKGSDCEKKKVQESDSGHAGVCLSNGQSVSKWQAKKKRNARKSPYCVGTEQHEETNFCKSVDIYRDQKPNARHMHVRPHTGDQKPNARHMHLRPHTEANTYLRPLRQTNSKLWATNSATPSISIRSGLKDRNVRVQKVRWVSRSPTSSLLSHDTPRQASCWVDVRVEFRVANRKENVQLVSLFSQVMNRAVLGYPVAVQNLENRLRYGASSYTARYGASSNTAWSGSKLEVSGRVNTTRVPRCPMRNALKQRSLKNDAAYNGRPMPKGCKISRKSGSMLQKTRTLSSLATNVCKVRTEPEQRRTEHEQRHESYPSNVSKVPLVTCVPVHVVFHRIRQVLYKQSDDMLNKNCGDKSANSEW
eukprot:c21698_g1_i1 orf=928-3594(+)